MSIGWTNIMARTFPNISIDGSQFDLIPNNQDQIGNVKILNQKVRYDTNPWCIEYQLYIDGNIYYKKANLSD